MSRILLPYLVGGLEHFLFSHILGIIIPIDFHIFQRGSNHQPDIVSFCHQFCPQILVKHGETCSTEVVKNPKLTESISAVFVQPKHVGQAILKQSEKNTEGGVQPQVSLQVGPTSDMVEKGPPVPEDWVGKQRCLALKKRWVKSQLSVAGNS